jgi:hypothetical protein
LDAGKLPKPVKSLHVSSRTVRGNGPAHRAYLTDAPSLRQSRADRASSVSTRCLAASHKISLHHHLPSGHNVCTEITHSIYKVAVSAEINARIESQAQTFFPSFQSGRRDGSNRLPALPTKRQMGICKMAPRSILTLPTENISYPIR